MRPLVDNAFRIVITGSFALAVACSFWSTDIIGTVYDHDIEAASSLFKLLMWAFVFMMTSYVWGTLLTAHGNMRGMNTVAAVAVVLNIALNAWLIPEHGAFGSAAASLATQILVAFTQMILVSRSTGTAPQAPTLMRSALYLGVLLAAAFGMKHLAWGVAVELVLFGAIAAVSALSLGLIKRVQFSQLLRTNEGAGE